MQFRPVPIFALCLFTAGCGGRETPVEGVIGQYVVEGTCVATAQKSEKTDGTTYYGYLQGLGNRYNGLLTVNATDSRNNVKVSDFEGCSFLAERKNGEATAAAVVSDPFTPGSPLATMHVNKLEIISFYLSQKDGLFRNNFKTMTQPSDPTLVD